MKRSKIIIYSLLLLLLTSCDYILYIKWIQSMKNYKWYAGSIVFPIIGSLFFWIPVWINRYILKKDYSIENKFSQKKLFILGSFDSISSILTTYSTPYLTVVMMTLLDKLSLPLTMIASFFYLGTDYLINHYLGAFLTIYGLLVAFIPDMENENQKYNYYWLIVYISSLIPSVLSFCYKEKNLKKVDLDIWWMNGCISIWQILFGILTFPIIFAPLPSGENLKLNEIGPYFKNATYCQFSNYNSLSTDKCENSFVILILYQIISTLANILMFMIIREESSAVYLVINTIKMPVTAWLGSYPKIVGSQAQKVNVADFFSFIMIIVGIIVYNYKEEKDERRKSKEYDELHFQLTRDSNDI